MAIEKHQQYSKGQLVGEQIGTTGNLHSVDVSKGPIAATTGKVFSEADQTSPQNVNAPINTPQPDPAKPVQAVPPPIAPNPNDANTKIPFNQALKNLGTTDRTAVGTLAQSYQQGLAQTKASGTPPPATMGQAASTIQSTVPPPPADTSNIDTALAEDKGYQQLLSDQKEYTDTANQQKSLVDTYNEAIKKAGIPAINTELLNTQKIINGTEDDIRNEVQAVSGFATDSQVLALSSARNKSLIQNYNNLLNTKQMAMDNITTMIGLAKEDQQNALANITAKMGIDEKLLDYRDKMVSAAQEGYNAVIKAQGYDGLYKSLIATGDPNTVTKAEQTLGLASGSLKELASQPNLDTELKQAQIGEANANIAQSKASTAKAYNDIKVANNPFGTTPGGASTALSPYLKTSWDGTQYADLSSLTPSDKAKYAQLASSSGVTPILDSGTAGKLNGISVSKENLSNIGTSIESILNDESPGGAQGAANSLKSAFGNADIRSFNAWRTAVINNVQALAGGQGSGLRINQAEIDTALKNDLPVITGARADTLSQAQAKIKVLNSQLDTWTKQILGGGNTVGNAHPDISVGSTIEYQGKKYHVSANGDMTPI